ncbi:MAG: DUF4349 domain-containing protein [Polyangiaceae bacterium]
MPPKLRRGLSILALGFVVLFSLRLAYGYHSQPNREAGGPPPAVATAFELDKHNYASSKMHRRKGGDGGTATVDQKYERVAQLSMQSRDFASDEKEIRDVVGQHRGLVQFEERSGLSGGQTLQLAVGVDPARFDELVQALRKIGELASIHIHKVDKTNDYKELQAARRALVATRDALTALKTQGGRVDELMSLEQSILEHEERIQKLGVQLGEFDEENEFCTVKLTLAELAPLAAVTIPFVHRAKVAFEWTAVFYLRLVGIALGGALLLLVLLALAQRLRAVQFLLASLETSGSDEAGPSGDITS